jgi:hypothetical protein
VWGVVGVAGCGGVGGVGGVGVWAVWGHSLLSTFHRLHLLLPLTPTFLYYYSVGLGVALVCSAPTTFHIVDVDNFTLILFTGEHIICSLHVKKNVNKQLKDHGKTNSNQIRQIEDAIFAKGGLIDSSDEGLYNDRFQQFKVKCRETQTLERSF